MGKKIQQNEITKIGKEIEKKEIKNSKFRIRREASTLNI